MNRRGLLGLLGGALALAPGLRVASARAAAPPKMAHRVAIHVDTNDTETLNLVLNNAKNVLDHYSEHGDEAAVEIVAYGPGLHMLREDTSPVKARLASFREKAPNVRFSACNNTKLGMEKAEKKTIVLVPGAVIVPAGVVRLMELQEDGWSYLRP